MPTRDRWDEGIDPRGGNDMYEKCFHPETLGTEKDQDGWILTTAPEGADMGSLAKLHTSGSRGDERGVKPTVKAVRPK